jgi:hypothetical protein
MRRRRFCLLFSSAIAENPCIYRSRSRALSVSFHLSALKKSSSKVYKRPIQKATARKTLNCKNLRAAVMVKSCRFLKVPAVEKFLKMKRF